MKDRSFPVAVTALVGVISLYLLRLDFLRIHAFDPDEFYHLHSAFNLSKGLLPYRDYFEQHTPWFYFLMAPLIDFAAVDLSFERAKSFIFLTRILMWLSTGAIFVMTFWLARLWRGTRVAWIAALCLSLFLTFLDKSIEIRPDVPSVALLLAAIAFLLMGIRSRDAVSSRTSWLFTGSGLFLGIALMFQQKILFVMPGWSAAMLWYLFDPRAHDGEGAPGLRLKHALWQFLAFCTPVLLTLGYFALHNATAEFVEYNLLLNLRYPHKVGFSAMPSVKLLLRQNPIVVALGLAGLLRALIFMFRGDRFREGDFAPVLIASALVVGLFIFPTPNRQYYLMLLPLLAIFAATAIVHSLDFAANQLERGEKPDGASYPVEDLFGLLVLVVFGLTLLVARPFTPNGALYLVMWITVLAGVIWLLRSRAREWAFALFLAALCVYPVQQMFQIWSPLDTKYQETLDQIRWVMENTEPTDRLMDGFTGLGVFRPDAAYQWLLLRDARMWMSRRQYDTFVAGLESGTIAPKLVFFDGNLRRFSDRVASFVRQNFEPTGRGVIWKRNDIWLDHGPYQLNGRLELAKPPTAILAGPGWYEPEEEDGISFRRSRGRRSWLRVPLRTPRPLRVTIHARPEFAERPVRLKLAVNGKQVRGTRVLSSELEWQDFVFTVPASILRSGVNSFLLTYSRVPRQADPSYRGRNTVIAVDYLLIVPAD